ncbi:MAG: IPT/TIG domain-containing protein [Candidatus Eremiobacteraeota bacterium]|nr:IPT/TIG domain-containing protein [Candidatus Eremiobacteraeota bacterium]
MLVFALNGCGGGGTSDSGYYWGGGGTTVTSPTITSCSIQGSVAPGAVCTLGGTSFGSAYKATYASYVLLTSNTAGGQNVSVSDPYIVSWSDTQIVFYIPSTVVNGQTYTISVVKVIDGSSYGSSTQSGVSTTVTPTTSGVTPSISSILPANQSAGQAITITGTGFGTAGYVKFGSTNQTTITSYGTTSIICNIPSTIAAGAIQISVFSNQNGVSSGTSYTVGGSSPTTANITAVNPRPVVPGNQITITGTNFGTAGAVTINNLACTTTGGTNTWAATSIVCTTPATGLTAGATVNVVVTPTGATASNAYSTTIYNPATDPSITSPTSLALTTNTATTATLTGTNFGTTAGTVTINSTPSTTCTISTWANTSVAIGIPAIATAGTYTLTLTTSGNQTTTISVVVSGGGAAASWRGALTMDGNLGGQAGAFFVVYDPRTANANDCVTFWRENSTSGGATVVYWTRRYTSATTAWATTAQQVGSQTVPGVGAITDLTADVNASGVIMAAYHHANTNQIYWSAYAPATDTWTPNATALSVTAAGAGTHNPDIAFSANSNAMCVFRDTVASGDANITARFWNNTLQAWDATPLYMGDVSVAIPVAGAARPQVGFDNNNNGLVVFLQDTVAVPGQLNVFARRYAYDATTPWAAARFTPALTASPTNVSNTGNIGIVPALPALAVDDLTGNGAASWVTGTPQAFVARFDQASTAWGAAAAVDANVAWLADTTPQCAWTSDGRILAVFNENDAIGGVCRVWANVRAAGSTGTWGTATRIDDAVNGGQGCFVPSLSMNPAGTLAVVGFIQTSSAATGAVNHVKMNTYTPSTATWSGTGTSYLDANSGLLNTAVVPACAMNGTPQIVILFMENTRVYFNQYR